MLSRCTLKLSWCWYLKFSMCSEGGWKLVVFLVFVCFVQMSNAALSMNAVKYFTKVDTSISIKVLRLFLT